MKPCPANFGDNGAPQNKCSVPRVSVYPMATTGMQPPGKADIPQSKAILPGYKNTTSLDMRPIPEHERQNCSEETPSTPSGNSNEVELVVSFTWIPCICKAKYHARTGQDIQLSLT